MKQILPVTLVTFAIVSAVAARDTLCGRTKIRPYSGGRTKIRPYSGGRTKIRPYSGAGQFVGREAKPGSWPWQVSLRLFDKQCGGSLIHPSWVLTSKRCVEGKTSASNWTVVVGEHNLKSVDPNEQEIEIEKIITHGKFNVDLALIKLRNPVNLTNYVNVVCLPTDLVPNGKEAFVTGFGTKDSKCCPGILKEVKVFIDTITCFSMDYLGRFIDQHTVCAAPKRNDTEPCKEDYGGPLVVKGKRHWVLVGVSSYNDGCYHPKTPGVYTEVFDFIPWIQETLASYA